jgi:integrase
MPKSSTKVLSKKPNKPYADFPLFPHATGRWAKKVRGRLHYFGKWGDPQGALDKWLEQKDALLAGRKPRPKSDGATVRDLANAFLNAMRQRVDTRELTPRSWTDLYTVCARMVKVFGPGRQVDDLEADDFEALRKSFASSHGLVALQSDLTKTRTVLNWGVKMGQIPDRNYASMIVRPTAKAIRRDRLAKPRREFSKDELRALIDAAPQPMRAMILLGINAGYGNQDCALLTQDYIDLEAGWICFPRPKTGAQRRARLWPETVAALRKAIAQRPKPLDSALAQRVFITLKGNGFEARTKTPAEGDGDKLTGYDDNPISKQFAKLLNSLGMRRLGNGFYSLRRMFETIGGGCLDQVAVSFIMGHIADSGDMSAVYRQHIADSRLEAVANHVHAWLFSSKKKKLRRKAK